MSTALEYTVDPVKARRVLRPWEAMFLLRRRRGWTIQAAADHYGLDYKAWRRFETGAEDGIPGAVMRDAPGANYVRDWEWMLLWRRRHGWNVEEGASLQGISHVTLQLREKGKGLWEPSYHWWIQHGGEPA
jgi:hypothetical protein